MPAKGRISLLLLLSPIAASAGEVHFKITRLVLERDEIPGIGLVTSVNNLVVNNAGQWIVELDTDHPDPNADVLLLRDGVVYLREGQAIDPPPATISSFDSVTLNSAGDSAFNFFLDGTGGLNNDSGVYFNTNLLIQESDLVNLPEFSPSTPYIGFFDVKINDAGRLLLMASIDDPNIPTSVDRALILLDSDGGNETVILKEGDVPPGQTEQVADFLTGPHATAINDLGQCIYAVDLTGDTAADIAVYVDHVLVAQEGLPSGVDGRNWSTLGSAKVDLTNTGNYVISGGLAGDAATNLVIVSRTGKVVQEGDTFGDIAPWKVTGFGSGPVLMSDREHVLWWGDWDDPDTGRDTGLFLGDKLLIQEGVTVINGRTVARCAASRTATRSAATGASSSASSSSSMKRSACWKVPSCSSSAWVT
ncbi:MAG: hypothetical protein HUU27_00500 [Phycisphaerae bacterium]|nr:hypothetical protein [Phycisphaerae bacterium]